MVTAGGDAFPSPAAGGVYGTPGAPPLFWACSICNNVIAVWKSSRDSKAWYTLANRRNAT